MTQFGQCRGFYHEHLFLFTGVKDECHILSYQVISACEGGHGLCWIWFSKRKLKHYQRSVKLCCDYSNSFSNVKVGNEIGAEDRRSRPSSYTILFVTYILDAAKFVTLPLIFLNLKF